VHKHERAVLRVLALARRAVRQPRTIRIDLRIVLHGQGDDRDVESLALGRGSAGHHIANGANDNFKGVATLCGSRTTNYRRALVWATVCAAVLWWLMH
jgi:hypothetical protein